MTDFPDIRNLVPSALVTGRLKLPYMTPEGVKYATEHYTRYEYPRLEELNFVTADFNEMDAPTKDGNAYSTLEYAICKWLLLNRIYWDIMEPNALARFEGLREYNGHQVKLLLSRGTAV